MFAFGNKHPLHEVIISANIKCQKPIAIAIHDQRPYVSNGSKSATFIGSMRSGVGIPYDINTKSGKPLADDMLEVVSKALAKNGNTIIKVQTHATLSKDAVIEELKKTNAYRNIYISILEWKTDTYMNAQLFCLLHLYVMNENGEVIAENSVKANDENFGGSFWNPKKAAKKGSLKALKMKLEALINDEKILKAFE